MMVVTMTERRSNLQRSERDDVVSMRSTAQKKKKLRLVCTARSNRVSAKLFFVFIIWRLMRCSTCSATVCVWMRASMQACSPRLQVLSRCQRLPSSAVDE